MSGRKGRGYRSQKARQAAEQKKIDRHRRYVAEQLEAARTGESVVINTKGAS